MSETAKVTNDLADAQVRDGDKTLRLGDLWRSRPVLLLWVRHFG
jgi:hypothetical protein